MSLAEHLPNMAMRAAGRPLLTTPRFKRWDPEAFCTQGGSKNDALMGYAAAGDFQWISEVCRLQVERHGLWLDELGAPGFYTDGPMAAHLLCLRLAREAGEHGAARWIERVVRAWFHFAALAAVPTPVRRGWMMIGVADAPGRVLEDPDGNAAGYDGVTCAAVGDRWNAPAYVGGDTQGWWLSWASGWQPRRSVPPRLGIRARQGGGSGDVIANLGKVGSYGEDVAPEVFGLLPGDRERLQAVIRGDADAATEAAAIVVEDCPPHADYDITRTRTTAGGEAWSLCTRNGNKPHAAACTVTLDGFRRVLVPAAFRKLGAAAFDLKVGSDRFVGRSRDESGETLVEMPRLGGGLLYGFRFVGRSVERVDGGAVARPPERPNPPAPPPEEPDEPMPPPSPPETSGPPIPASGRHVTFRGDGADIIVNILPGGKWEGRRFRLDGGDWQTFR